jgi:hypothetical protein
MDTTMNVSPPLAQARPVIARAQHRALSVFCCPCCGAPSQDFAVVVDAIGICLSMVCATCHTPVEGLIRCAVVPTIGLA